MAERGGSSVGRLSHQPVQAISRERRASHHMNAYTVLSRSEVC